MTRTYDRTLREAQAQQTRLAILDAALALAGEDEALSFARVAERAGVSEPTVYRNFSNREALVAALADHVSTKLRAPRMPDDVEDLPAAALATAMYFRENPSLLRAATRTSGLTHDVRQVGRARRAVKLRELLDGPTKHLEKKDAEAVRALVAALVRADTFLEMTDKHGVDGERAGFALAWALDALLDALRRERTKGVRTIVDEKMRSRAEALRAATATAGGRER